MFYGFGGDVYLTRPGITALVVCNAISLLFTFLMVAAFIIVPALSRRQLSRNILYQCIADFLWSALSMGMQFKTPCGVVLNKYLYVLSVYSAAWSCVLAFHLLQQARGHWVEVETYGPRYHLATFTITMATFLVIFGEQGWNFSPCFADDSEGVNANGIFVIVIIVCAVLWQLLAWVWIRVYLRIKLYTARYLIAYVFAWGCFFAWFVAGINLNRPDHQANFTAAGVCMLSLLGAINVILFGTMPPTYILKRIHLTVSDEIANRWGTTSIEKASQQPMSYVGSLEAKLLDADGLDPEASQRMIESKNLTLNAESSLGPFFSPSQEVIFDQAAEDYLWFNIMELSSSESSNGLILPTSLISIDDPVGTGSFSTVYKGSYQNMTVAVKELRCVLTRGGGKKNQRTFSQFLSEVEIMIDARHPNLACLVGLSMRENGKLLIISEFYKSNLRHYLAWEGRTCTEHNKLRLCFEVCSGLTFLHSKGIIHRDVKPENIFLDDHHQAKLGDFGCSKAEAALNSPQVFGTPAYLAPEIFDLSRGRSKSAKHQEALPVFGQGIQLEESQTRRGTFSSRRATFSGPIRLDAITSKLDIYALGITFWEVMSGQIPYVNLTFARSKDLYAAVTEGLRPDPFELRTSHRPVAEACWTFNSSARPTAAALCTLLKDLQSLGPSSKHGSVSSYRSTSSARAVEA
eukprot:m.151716 g.151716  ORF g.151716 m.151716 type:complete len:689 (-) comp30775_c0_seq1:20-2086(-)